MQFVIRHEPGAFWSATLALLVHGLLLALLIFGVRWQSRQPDAMQVELWSQLPVIEQAPPIVQPRPEPKPEPKLEPKLEPKPTPKVAPPPKPDIALKQEPPPKKPAKPDPRKLMNEQLASEQAELKKDLDRQAEQRQAAAAVRARDDAIYKSRIAAKIRSNIVIPPDVLGNPEVIFDVVQLPTGDIIQSSVRLKKSSGFKSYDDAVERAILKSSPLPRADRPELYQRDLELKFHPLD